jgi:hypothetical protein
MMREPRHSKTSFLVYGVIFLAVLYLGAVGWDRWTRAKYEQRMQALEAQVEAATSKAKQAEAAAAVLQREIDIKAVELEAVQARANAAETNLRQTRQLVVPLKEAYDRARLVPFPNTPVSIDDACAEARRLGYSCN